MGTCCVSYITPTRGRYSQDQPLSSTHVLNAVTPRVLILEPQSGYYNVKKVGMRSLHYALNEASVASAKQALQNNPGNND